MKVRSWRFLVPPFLKQNKNSEISSFGKGVEGRNKVGGLQQKGEVGIDECDVISHEGACIGGHQDLAEFIRL